MTPISYAPLVFPALPLLPPSATAFETALSLTSARILNTDTEAVRRARDPLRCDIAFLPFLGWERSVHHYTGTNEAADRDSVDSSFDDHCSYGAPAALEVEIALDTGQIIRVVEFFEEFQLVWPDFVVESLINPGDPTPDLLAVRASALRRKPPRDKLHSVRTRGLQPAAAIEVGCAARVSLNPRILPVTPVNPVIPPAILTGAGARVYPRYRVLPMKAQS